MGEGSSSVTGIETWLPLRLMAPWTIPETQIAEATMNLAVRCTMISKKDGKRWN
jgi:hypothetical protein